MYASIVPKMNLNLSDYSYNGSLVYSVTYVILTKFHEFGRLMGTSIKPHGQATI